MKATDLAAYAAKALDEKWGYVLGGQGEMYLPELAAKWAAAKQGGMGRAYFFNTCSRWFGHRVADCSGLIIAALQSENAAYPDMASGTLFSRCTETGAISTLPETRGLCLWRPGHIGIYIGGGYAIEARGAAYGVVRTAVAARSWTHWGKLRDVEYTQETSGTESTTTMGIYRMLTYKKPMLVGDDVQWLQRQLTERGHKCGTADGIFGTRTLAGVKAFQQAKRLVVDGIAGKNTITALGGIYMGR